MLSDEEINRDWGRAFSASECELIKHFDVKFNVLRFSSILSPMKYLRWQEPLPLTQLVTGCPFRNSCLPGSSGMNQSTQQIKEESRQKYCENHGTKLTISPCQSPNRSEAYCWVDQIRFRSVILFTHFAGFRKAENPTIYSEDSSAITNMSWREAISNI
jgi:hypothetical protein